LSDIRDRLRRLRRDADPEAPRPAAVEVADGGYDAGWPADVVVGEGRSGESVAARTTVYEVDAEHGSWRLDEIDAADTEVFPRLTGDASLAELDLRRAVYLDVETTGLSGGAGIYVFLVALGTFDGDRFELWQGFLPDPAGERELMAEVARRVEDASSVVSFFGKSFDRHRLEDKMQICGVKPTFAGKPHLDLYHPLSSIYRGAWSDGRLCTCESELVGVRRVDDLPGSFAPAAWMDFLSERAHRLEDVFRHNRDDVLSLVTLAAHLGRVESEFRRGGAELDGPADVRAAGLARTLDRFGHREQALVWIERALERWRGEPSAAIALRMRQADLWRLGGEASLALDAYRELAAAGGILGATCRLQESKLLEHKLKDYPAALDACRQALELLAAAGPYDRERARLEEDGRRRAERLRTRV